MRSSSRPTQRLQNVLRLWLTLAGVIGVSVGPLLAPLLQTCDGEGDYLQYEGSYTSWYQVCVTECGNGPSQPACSGDCSWHGETHGIFSCQHTSGPGPGAPPTPPGGGPEAPPAPPPPPINPKDRDNNGEIDCWKQTLDTEAPNVDLGPDQFTGTEYGGTNALRPCHSGIDIDCHEGDPLYAPASGTITRARDNGNGGGGFVVWIAAGLYRYDTLHMSRIADIVEGDQIRVGDLIGYCGHSGGGEVGDHSHLRVIQSNEGKVWPDCQSPPDMDNFNVFEPEVLSPCPQ